MLKAKESRVENHTARDFAPAEVARIHAQMLSNLAHELRAVLTAIQGYTKRVLEERDGPVNPAQKEHLTIAVQNIHKLTALASHTLRYLSTEQLHLELLDLRDLWMDALAGNQNQLLRNQIKVIEKIPDESFCVAGDREKLALVFDSFLDNLLYFAGGKAELSVEFQRSLDGEVRVKCSRAGLEIDSLLLEQIFLPGGRFTFARPAGQTPPRVELSVAHDIAWLHGGRVSTMQRGDETSLILTLQEVRA